MTAQPTRDQLEAELDSWMTRAYEAEKRAWQAEKRIKAVEDACDLSAEDAEDMAAISAHYASGYEIALQDIRRALESDPPPSA